MSHLLRVDLERGGKGHGRRAALAALALLAVAVTSGCAAVAEDPATAAPSAALAIPPGPSLPACANAGAAVLPASGFPASFPLPDGAVVVEADTPPGGGSRIRFLAPLDIDTLGTFLEHALPRAGLSIGGGEAEADELESKFSGNGLDGQLTAREVPGCPGVLSVQVVTRST